MLQRRIPGRLMGSVPLWGGGQTYLQKVKGIQRSNQILYHPMNEASGVVASDYSPENNDGVYTGVTLGQAGIGDGKTCPLFDGANDMNNIYSVGLNADFDGDEGTIALWAKVNDLGVWTDGSPRRSRIAVDGNNYIEFLKDAGNNSFTYRYNAGGVLKAITLGSQSWTDWAYLTITWSSSADQMKAFKNGVQQGITQAGLGIWAGNLGATLTIIGALNNTPIHVWYGWLAHAVIWKVALTPAEVLEAATL